MKTTVLLVRHGQSLGNLRESFLGHTDLDLSPLGVQQATLLGEHLKDRPIDAAEASDLQRAYHTAVAALRYHGITPKENAGFREIFAGEWENLRFDDIAATYPDEWSVWRTDIGRACPVGGESVAALAERVYAAFDDLVTRYAGKTVLVGTHATPIRLLKCHALSIPVADAARVPWAPNASLTEIAVEDGTLTLVRDGEDAFLGELHSALSSKV